jgi:tripartite-type tricarboxylate transporter receptor subunit TctC
MTSIELIVPYVLEGGTGQRARLLARHLEQALAEPIVPVSRTDALAGHTAVAAAPPGATLGMITGEIGMMHWNPGLTDLTWRAYTPLAAPYVEASAVLVRADAPYRTLADLLAAFRERPLKGSGSPHYGVWKFSLAGLLDAAGIAAAQLEWVPAIAGEHGALKVIAGEVEVAPVGMTEARTQLFAGKLRALANMDSKRHALFPDVPTVREAVGIDWRVAHWRGLVAPAGLCGERTQRYIGALRSVAADDRFTEAARANGFGLDWRFGDDFARLMEEDDAQFGRIIRLLNAK